MAFSLEQNIIQQIKSHNHKIKSENLLDISLELVQKYNSIFNSLLVEDIITELRNLVMNYEIAYRNEKPLITDMEFDDLYMLLEYLEEQNSQYYDPESPTQKITDTIVDFLPKVKHTSFMGSQEKITTEDELRKFLSTIHAKAIVQYKLDGLTIVVRYNNGKLETAITRGDGSIGEEVTHTVKTISNVPNVISYKGYLEIRLEAIIPFKEFERINVDGTYSNSRNLVSGTIRQLDASVARERNLCGIVFDLIKCDEKFETDEEQLKFLQGLGFETVNSVYFDQCQYEDLITHCITFEDSKRAEIPYAIDGLVVKIDNLDDRKVLGYRSKSPRWACAYKFKSLEAMSYLRTVEWNVGRTGQVTPVAIFDEVDIDNVFITRATLHNMDYINSRDLKINDKILVARANDVIPQVVQSIKDSRKGTELKIEEPSICPCCESSLEKEGANLFCRNLNCREQVINKIIAWCSRARLNIVSMGKETVAQLYNANIVKSIADIYNLKDRKEEFVKLEGLGIKTFNKIIASIEDSKEATLDKVLYGLSIPNIGETASKDLANKFGNITNIIDLSKDKEKFITELLSVKDFGEKMSESMYQFFTDDDSLELIEDLRSVGMKMESEIKEPLSQEDQALSGLKFVITGTLSKPRNYFKSKIELLGGAVSGSVSSKTDYLLAGDEAGSKLNKAKNLGVKILNEDEFVKLTS